MFKKAIPFILVSGLALTACAGNNNNDGVPNNNETPMENLDDGLRDTTPRVNNGAGPNMDGIDNGTDGNNGANGGIIKDNRSDGILTDDPNDTTNQNRNENNNNNR
ncbi:hypothetical protein [Sporosarcina sp. UB5]|uniref:hypothetical protein n=1 Tax=Sporosarcina sp. UB5 TaxID=3047463 RepID=UPI003D7A8AAC